jgi:hypothetical protein
MTETASERALLCSFTSHGKTWACVSLLFELFIFIFIIINLLIDGWLLILGLGFDGYYLLALSFRL